MARSLLALGAAFMLAGCANLNSIYRFDDMSAGGAVLSRTTLIDSDQRAITTQVRRSFVIGPDGLPVLDRATQQPLRESYATVCAEKSPDTFAAQSGSLSGGVDAPRVSGTLAVALAESAASIALRTQLTQAQAELLFRICEAHANQAISGFEVHRQLRRFQNTMVALLAIEQLTGAIQVQNVALTGSAAATTDQAVIQARRQLDAAAAAVQRAETELAAAREELAGSRVAFDQASAAVEAGEQANSSNLATLRAQRNAAEVARGRAESRVNSSEGVLSGARQARDRAQAALAAAESGSAAAGGAAIPLAVPPNRQPRPEEVGAVAVAVQAITELTITGQQTTVELCHDVLAGEFAGSSQGEGGRQSSAGPRATSVFEFCMTFLARNANAEQERQNLQARARLLEAERAARPAVGSPTPPAVSSQPSRAF